MNGGRIFVKMRKFKINDNISPFYSFIFFPCDGLFLCGVLITLQIVHKAYFYSL